MAPVMAAFGSWPLDASNMLRFHRRGVLQAEGAGGCHRGRCGSSAAGSNLQQLSGLAAGSTTIGCPASGSTSCLQPSKPLRLLEQQHLQQRFSWEWPVKLSAWAPGKLTGAQAAPADHGGSLASGTA